MAAAYPAVEHLRHTNPSMHTIQTLLGPYPFVLIHTYHTHIYEVKCHAILRCKIEIEYVYEACTYYTTITITRTIRSDEHLQRMTVIHILALAQLAEVGIERHKRVRCPEIE